MRAPEEIYAEYKDLIGDESNSYREALKWALGDDFDRLDRKPLPKGIIYNAEHDAVAQWWDEKYYVPLASGGYTEGALIDAYGPDWVELVPKIVDAPAGKRFTAVKIDGVWGILDAENPTEWAEYDDFGDGGVNAKEGAAALNSGKDWPSEYEWTPKPH